MARLWSIRKSSQGFPKTQERRTLHSELVLVSRGFPETTAFSHMQKGAREPCLPPL